jgi:hypothetical protein
LVVQRKQDTVSVDRGDVRRVRLRLKEKTKTGRILGTVLLGALGVIGAHITDEISAGERAATVGIFGGLGYLLGWAADGPKRIVIYEVRKP